MKKAGHVFPGGAQRQPLKSWNPHIRRIKFHDFNSCRKEIHALRKKIIEKFEVDM
jgi:hypothetical protein